MSLWISAASIVGALGLFLAGQHWIVTGLRATRPTSWNWIASRLQRTAGRGTPFLTGLASALTTPTSAWSARATLGTVHTPGRPLEHTVWQTIGSCLALAGSAWLALAARSASGAFEPLAWTLLGLGGLLYAAVPRGRSFYWTALGLGACLLGLLQLDHAFSTIAGVRLDAWGLSMPVRLIVFALLGTAAATVLRSPGAILVAALFAADHGCLHITTGVALFVGASLGSLAVTLPAWKSDGHPQARRAALCMASFQCLVSALTILSLALVLPLLNDPPQPLNQPIWLLTAWSSAAILASTLICIPLVRPGVRIVESRLGMFDSDGIASPIRDTTTLALPSLTFDCMRQELEAMRKTASGLARKVLGEEQVSDFRTTRDIESVTERAQSIEGAARRILAREAPAELRTVCEWAPAAGAAYMETCQQMAALRRPDLRPALIPDSALRARVLQFRWGFLHFLEHGCAAETAPLQRAQERYQIEVQATDLKGRLLRACHERSIEPLVAHAALAGIDTIQSVTQALTTALARMEFRALECPLKDPIADPILDPSQMPAEEPRPLEDSSVVETPGLEAGPEAAMEPGIEADEPSAPLPSAPPVPPPLFRRDQHS
ncbi:MAG: hypothetical protein ACI8QZ_003867 [Chlamydiales bacterium]|jgi:hypothetical protein